MEGVVGKCTFRGCEDEEINVKEICKCLSEDQTLIQMEHGTKGALVEQN